MDKEILEIAQKIKNQGGRLYLVGGALRNKLLNRQVKDEDYCVVGITTEKFKELFPKSFQRGKLFEVFELKGKEFAMARIETKTNAGHKGFEITANKDITIEQDLARRDITINSIAQDVLTEEIIDPFNGIEDLKNKVIKATTEHFIEDPLRVYRVARFACSLKFKVEEDTLSSYPITLQETTMDTEQLLSAATNSKNKKEFNDNKIHSENVTSDMLSLMSSGAKTNNLYEFKKYLNNNSNKFKKYANDISYAYNLDLNIYKEKDNGYTLVNPDQIIEKLGMSDMNNMGELIGGATSSYNAFNEMLDNRDLIKEQYDIVAGKLPKNKNEVVLQVNKNNCISDYALYAIGVLDSNELVEKYKTVLNGGKVEDLKELEYSYDDLLEIKFKVLLNTDYYQKEGSIWVDKRSDEKYLNNILDNALELKVVGIIKAKEDTITSDTYGGILYTSDLTKYVINKINETSVARAQKENKNINIFTNEEFSEEEFNINNLTPEQKNYLSTLSQVELAEVIKNFEENSKATYETNLNKLGIVDLDRPSTINIYAKGFDDKEAILDLIDEYNKNVKEENKISYTDFIAVMMSGVSNIINIISYVLISFVSISLIVSSIMIGIITYISVLERTKEIGILRAIGASKKDISRVFNAETLIVGLSAGLIGILITILLNMPINALIKAIANVSNISHLPFMGAVILILISVILTVIAGLIPAKLASKKDPVEALRTE